ncbi:MAG: glycosyltransferase [Nitrososphaerales archaeon]
MESLQSEEMPLVTIGIPTYNREWSLAAVLSSILDFDYDKRRIRLSFVDNQSTDKTMQIIQKFKEEREIEYESITVDVANSNIPRARNICFDRASGTDYIFFLDSDIIAPRDTIGRLLKHFREDKSLGIASLPWDDKNSRKRAGLLYDAFAKPNGAGYAYKVGNGCNIVSMAVVHKIGGFNEKLRVHEDGEFCFRVRRAGYRIICDFSSQAIHLRDISVNAKFYLSFVNDSAETYLQLFVDRSPLIIAKYASSFIILFSLIVFILDRSLEVGLFFLASVLFAMWLNSSKMALDDGIRTKWRYRPAIGVLFTVATVMITLLGTARALGIHHGRKTH